MVAWALVVAWALASLWVPVAAWAEPIWKLEQPPPPGATPFAVPLGRPGDLEFVAANRGLLTVEGNASVPRGIYSYDGHVWHQLATVCGGPGDTAAIAIAGPSEFWTVAEPSRPRAGDGTALCHFKDGSVVASYSTALESSDPYRQMASAACAGPDDCWFGGFGAEDPTGERRGAFHLHWDGTSLATVYAPQGRGVSDIEEHQGALFESTVVGQRPNDTTSNVDLFEDEGDRPRLIHRIAGGRFPNDPFLPADLPGVPAQGSELLALDSDGEQLWAGGGGAASGPAAPQAGVVARPPLLARLVDGAWQEVPLTPGAFGSRDRIVDVAAVPGADYAWAAVEPFDDRGRPDAYAHVARIGADGSVTTEQLPASGAGRGPAAKIAFTSPTEGWMVTSLGWIFHLTDGVPIARDTDPAFQGTIDFRPNEAAEQFVPDQPPADDSELFKPPPIEIAQEPPPAQVRRLAPLLRRVRSRLDGRTLMVRFMLTRRARVALVAKRRGRVVARTRAKLMRRGRHTLRLRLDRRRWPQRLSFEAREPGKPGGGPGDTTTGGDVVTTPGGGDTVATRTDAGAARARSGARLRVSGG